MPHAWMMLRRDGGLEEVKLKSLYFLPDWSGWKDESARFRFLEAIQSIAF